MIEVKAPNKSLILGFKSLFLAGSIEMGAAEKWQSKLVRELSDIENLIVYNPRRDDWDSSWKQEKTNPQFTEQVRWELEHICRSDVVVFYFDKNTKSPITLMELGMIGGLNMSHLGHNAFVYCPDGFYRKGNVDITSDYLGIPVYEDYDLFLSVIRKRLI